MDWARAIERNSEALKRIVAALFAMLEEAGGAAVERLPRPIHRSVLSVLRPAEAALRRLIVIAARGLVLKPVPARTMPQGLVRRGEGRRPRPSFLLFDPPKRFAHQRQACSPAQPRVYVFALPGYDPRIPEFLRAPPAAPAPPPDDGCVDARRLTSRLEALKLALDDLPGQAKRLVRLRARRAKPLNFSFKQPMRPGLPPGYRKRQTRDVDRVLDECHALARYALAPVAAPSTSASSAGQAMLTHGPPLRG